MQERIISEHMIVHSVSDFYRVVNAIGYTMQGPTNLMSGTFYEIWRGGNNRVAVVLENFFMYRTPLYIVEIFDQIVGMHHMLCKKCKYPLLRYINTERATYLAQHATRPMVTYVSDGTELAAQELNKFIADPSAMLSCDMFKMQLDPSIKSAIVTEYRDTRRGPDSRPLELCPKCYQKLAEDTVREIVEPEAIDPYSIHLGYDPAGDIVRKDTTHEQY